MLSGSSAQIDSVFIAILLFWVLALAILLAAAWRGKQRVVGLTLAYFLNLGLIHWIAAAIQLVPWYSSPNRAETIVGFEITGYAIAGLLGGTLFVSPFLFRALLPMCPRPKRTACRGPLPVRYIVTGMICSFVLTGVLPRIPSLSAVLSCGLLLAVAGFCLMWWANWTAGRTAEAWGTLASTLIIPATGLVLRGFLSYGTAALLMVGGFVAVFFKPRGVVIALGLGCFMVGLPMYTTYMRARTEIRSTVWGGKDVEERVGTISSSFQKEWQWFDVDQTSNLEAIEGRLNQNGLLGQSVRYISQGNVSFADGETIWQSLQALVPRIVWRDKPEFAGSRGLVTRFTGIEFAPGTSVGIGQVMELYVNFGELGVLIGFVVIGAILGAVERVAARYLLADDWLRFVTWYVPGLAMLQVGGNFAEVTASVAAAIIFCLGVNRLIATPQAGVYPGTAAAGERV